MYLSQPRDLINSMSTGCSRGSIVVLPRDHDSLDSLVPSADIENLTALRPSLTCDQNRLKPHDTAELQTPPLSARAEGNPVSLVYTPPNTLTKALFSCDGISASRWFRAQHFQKIWERLDPGSPSLRPPHPYSELIKLCILKRREGKLTLCELYQDLEAKFFFYAKSSSKGRGWRNTIRHNLSTQPYFVKLEREPGQLGKGHYWTYCPDLEKPTSLAQSSIMQMTSLWSLSVRAPASLARDWSALEEHPCTPRSGELLSPLPRFENSIRVKEEVYQMPRVYSPPSTSSHASPTSMRRLSSPIRPMRSFSRQEIDQPALITRGRSATISTFSRPSSGENSFPAPPAGRQTRRASYFWSGPRTTSIASPPRSCLSDPELDRSGGEGDERVSRLPPLSPHGAAGCKSLGDYFLSNPISRR